MKLNFASSNWSKLYSVSAFQKVALAVNLASLFSANDFLNSIQGNELPKTSMNADENIVLKIGALSLVDLCGLY